MRRILVIVGGVLLLVAVVLTATFYAQLHRDHAGWQGPDVVVELPSGEPAGRLLGRLVDAGVLSDDGPLRTWLSIRGGGEKIRAGEYRFDQPSSPLTVLSRLQRGDILLHAVTIPEGRSIFEAIQDLVVAGIADEASLTRVFSDPSAVRELDIDATDLEGYLFPDTYHFASGVSAETVAETLVRRFVEVVDEEYIAAAAGHGLELHEAVILASLIEKESGVSSERPRIARVFHNRLKLGMPLQCDPTVLYAWARLGKPVGKLTRKHLEIDSPWNTYVYPGLPTGPIANPGEESLWAAVQPAEGDELYFVASPEGGHTFSRNYEEHRRAVRVWRAYRRSSPM
ncbi:MAG: endolytic transglycosylase MltG [Acidobacteriota bacterium]|nr:endolytic transglycosylase MltG [Acidobacteriota bacterium]MDH3784626.1 endolytic transglycosylase MltG [Acidobacteriota bacterium]